MGWREKLVIRILLLVAQIAAAGIEQFDPRLAAEIKAVANHVQVARSEEIAA